ncbi:LacI family DNA-binding transcriptional regulator [Demequina sp. SO4-18]|uniref:LacI family DNA-binding transcriptional regulator n=1 Tax=Demequina sp. SO4-18 TaxID=3401026 RepID=UPI003B5AC880
MATIYEVAAHAGVSPATVSRVINGIPVRPALDARVREAIAALQYRPSRRARALRTKRAEMIALVIPDLENPFFTALARGAEHVTRQAGYSLVLCNTDGDPDYEAAYVDAIQGEHMPGAIVAPCGDGEAFVPMLDQGQPLVAVDRRIADPRADTVRANNHAGAVEATEWQFAQGRSRIACITGPPQVETARERAQGWRDVVDRRGGAPDDYLIWADYRVEGGASAVEQLLDLPDPPHGIVAANNLIAIGILTALTRRGMRPGDITVSVCDSLPHLPVPLPGLHSVPTPARAIGEHAARLLLGRINGDTGPARTVVLDSTGAVVSSRVNRTAQPVD